MWSAQRIPTTVNLGFLDRMQTIKIKIITKVFILKSDVESQTKQGGFVPGPPHSPQHRIRGKSYYTGARQGAAMSVNGTHTHRHTCPVTACEEREI
jgi:hypothetical protein